MCLRSVAAGLNGGREKRVELSGQQIGLVRQDAELAPRTLPVESDCARASREFPRVHNRPSQDRHCDTLALIVAGSNYGEAGTAMKPCVPVASSKDPTMRPVSLIPCTSV